MLNKSDIATTTVTKVEWVTQGTGKLFPVIHYKPVKISGCTASKASGKSYRYISETGIGVGAKIGIVRSNNIVPNIAEVYRSVIPEPAKCQYGCDPDLLKIESKHIYCRNPRCPALMKTVFERFIDTFKPKSFSNAMRTVVMRAFDYDLSKMLKFYTKVNQPSLAKFNGLSTRGEKLVTQMLKNMLKWKLRFYQVVYIAVIEYFGEYQARQIEKLFPLGSELKAWAQSATTLFPDLVSKEKARINWARHHKIICLLLKYFRIVKPTIRGQREFSGFVFICGKLEKGSKKTFAAEYIEPYGYMWCKTRTDANIWIDVDGKETNKIKYAKKIRIKIIPIKEWLEKMEANK